MQQSPIQQTPPGAFRFNTDSSKFEYYDGNQWVSVKSDRPSLHTGATRGFFGGGLNNDSGGNFNNIDYYAVDTTGNTTDFGDMQSGYYNHVIGGGCYGNGTRGVWAGGKGGKYQTSTENVCGSKSSYITISTTGNASAGRDLDIGRAKSGSACSGD